MKQTKSRAEFTPVGYEISKITMKVLSVFCFYPRKKTYLCNLVPRPRIELGTKL